MRISDWSSDVCSSDLGAPTGTGINCTNPGDPVYNILQPGSNGITGLPPEVAGKYTTDSKSLYAEATADVTDAWFIDLAARFEDYPSFGRNTVVKAGRRINVTDLMAHTGSLGTGFRAPTRVRGG